MSAVIDTDIAIIGGGSAGISLARHLSALSTPPPTLVIEPKTPSERDCSWALWSTEENAKPYTSAIKGSWSQWQLVDNHGAIAHSGRDYQYLSLSAADYLSDCEAQLENPVSLRRESVASIQSSGNGGKVITDQCAFNAKYIYDSRPPQHGNNDLRQHFLGWEIICAKPISRPDIATLMDFRVDQSQGLHFMYVLPFSARHLLVESTLISTQLQDKNWYRNAIDQWLSSQGIVVEQQLREEYGVISLEPRSPDKGRIGAAGGAVRRSSGYGFTTIQQQSRQLARGIEQGNYAVPQPFAKFLNSMDAIFNGVLIQHPQLAIDLFMRTARSLNADQFARFMLGEAGFSIWTKVIAAMPKIPFLKQALLTSFRRRGAHE